jgi:hypothetical protein
LDETEKKKSGGAGPTGRMRRLFEAVPKLPRSQQEKIAAVLEAFVNRAPTARRERERATLDNSSLPDAQVSSSNADKNVIVNP